MSKKSDYSDINVPDFMTGSRPAQAVQTNKPDVVNQKAVTKIALQMPPIGSMLAYGSIFGLTVGLWIVIGAWCACQLLAR